MTQVSQVQDEYIQPKVPSPPNTIRDRLDQIKKEAHNYTVQITKCGKGGYLVIENGEMCAKSTLGEAMDYVKESAHANLGEPLPDVYARPPVRNVFPNTRDGGQPEKYSGGGGNGPKPEEPYHSRSDQYDWGRDYDLDPSDHARESVIERIRNANFGLAMLAFGVTVATFVLGNVLTPGILAALPR